MIDRAELKARAKQMLSGNIGMLIVCFIIMAALEVVCNMIPLVGPIASICVSGPLAQIGRAHV